MTLLKSLRHFEEIKDVFEKALASDYGLRIPCPTREAAVALRYRFNYYRKVDRERSREVYQPSHPRWGRSAFDDLTLRVPRESEPDSNVLYIEPRLKIENLPIIDLSPPTG